MHASAWDGSDRRDGGEDEYTGPERRAHASHAERITQARLRTLESQMGDIAAVITEAVAQGMRQALTDPAVLSQVWSAAMEQGQQGLHQRVGRFVFSRWTGIAAMFILLASYIGWPATLKVIFGMFKGGTP